MSRLRCSASFRSSGTFRPIIFCHRLTGSWSSMAEEGAVCLLQHDRAPLGGGFYRSCRCPTVRRDSFSANAKPTPGRLHGQTAMQIAQPCVWLKNGRHLSKSTYHFSTPRTTCLSAEIASGGHAFSQTLQFKQKESTSKVRCGVGANGASVNTAERRNDEPSSAFIKDPCLPSSPKPAAIAGGIIMTFDVIGPVSGSASQPCSRSHPLTSFAAAAARPY